MRNISPAEFEARKVAYFKHAEEVNSRQRANADAFDKAILTCSTGGLALSIAFLKDIVPFSTATSLWLLFSSWGAFVLAIVSTIVAYMAAQRDIPGQLKAADRYYLQDDEAAAIERRTAQRVANSLTDASGFLFIAGALASVVFVGLNVERGAALSTRDIRPDSARAISAPQLIPMPTQPAAQNPIEPSPQPQPPATPQANETEPSGS
jgi:hypothetical protein